MREVVVFVGDGGQVRDNVLDFRAFVELRSTDEPVRHALAHENFFECASLSVRPIEHRNIAVGHPGIVKRRDFVCDKLRFIVLSDSRVTRDRLARAAIAKQFLRHRGVEVVSDNGVRRIEDVLGRAVVLLEDNDAGTRKILPELENVADVCSAECVNRLVGVTHHRDGRRVDSARVVEQRGGRFRRNVFGPDGASQFVNEFVLRLVGVLVFVNEHVTKASLIQRADFRESPKQEDRLGDEVVEVKCVGSAKFLCISAEDIEKHDLVRVVGIDLARVCVGVDEFVFEFRHFG